MTARQIIFPTSEWVPNNPRFSVLVYKVALTDAKSFENLFAYNGWSGIWTNGVFDYQHYHSAAHEVLGISQGHATLLIGGPAGEAIKVKQGDCLLLPAGTGHRNMDSSADFQVVGAYPPGQQVDILTSAATAHQLSIIRTLPRPETDPVTGASGGLIECWDDAVPVN